MVLGQQLLCWGTLAGPPPALLCSVDSAELILSLPQVRVEAWEVLIQRCTAWEWQGLHASVLNH